MIQGSTARTALSIPPTDLRLPADINPGRTAQHEPPPDVLLTGATGYLGAYLLRELHNSTPGTVRCLVRAADGREATARLAARCAEVGVPAEAAVAVAGDFTRPQFGLDDAYYQALADRTGTVYHCGASVNMNDPYQLARVPNVQGTVEVLRFAAYGPAKAVHHVSTMAVFISARACGTDLIGDDSAPSLEYSGTFGYPASKYVAEELVRQAAARGVPAAIHRPPFVLGDSATGMVATGEPLSTLMRVCVQLRTAPETLPQVPVCTVDHAARAITALAPGATRTQDLQAFNLHDPDLFPLDEAVHALRRAGHEITSVPLDDWLAQLAANRRVQPARSLYAMFDMLPYLVEATPEHRLPTLAPSRVTSLLTARGIDAPVIDEAYLARLTAWTFPPESN
ncbi:thioester reductase domain-containing protein [Streptomyces sp. NPDC021093]|uniref:thioester reductase domain-containing protein n=1 Tax=Streptomyces sp. NPDC021093 TaxID=3365112 RepID=UPI0037A4D829